MKNVNTSTLVLGIISAILAVVGLILGFKLAKENQEKVDAQNEVARLSKVVRETDKSWSRLAQQKDNLLETLEQENAELAEIIDDRNERILEFTRIIANFKPVHVVIPPGDDDIEETPEGDRIRVSFDRVSDPIRVQGFTLTNPAEADLTVSFVRPLRLQTVVTQAENGSWKTYISSDWPNLEIENIETVVNPYPPPGPKWYERIWIYSNLNTNLTFNDLNTNLALVVDIDEFMLGPSVGFGVVDGSASLNYLGIALAIRPF